MPVTRPPDTQCAGPLEAPHRSGRARRAAPWIGVALVVVELGGCAVSAKNRPSLDCPAIVTAAVERAHRGSLRSLEASLAMLHDAQEGGCNSPELEQRTVEANLLVAMRRNELGMAPGPTFSVVKPQTEPTGNLDRGPYLESAREELRRCRGCGDLGEAIQAVQAQGLHLRGVAGEDVERLYASSSQPMADLDAWFERLATRSGRDVFWTYVFLSFWHSYQGRFGPFQDQPLPDLVRNPGGQPPLVAYVAALLRREARPDVWEGLLARDPDFYEVHYRLGVWHLDLREYGAAERELRIALEGLPDSPNVTMALGDVYLAVEDPDAALEQYERTVTLFPRHREALLDKAICQGALGRHEEALATLRSVEALPGDYLPSRRLFWQAWNDEQLGRLDDAWSILVAEIENLPEDVRLLTLAGRVAHERGDTESARSYSSRAIALDDSVCEAHLCLARIAAAERDDKAAGGFARTGRCYGDSAAATEASIRKVEHSNISQAARDRILARKSSELAEERKMQVTALTAAGKSFLLTGNEEEGCPLLRRAAILGGDLSIASRCQRSSGSQ
jgi:tetratricopeptide (TPR) repeat protein